MSGQIIGLDKAISKVISLAKQTKFATAQALNDTAKDVQAHTINRQLPSKFTLRSKGAPWWKPGTKYGFNIAFANKSNLQAVIGSRFEPMGPQERGGPKLVKAGHRAAIPTTLSKAKSEIMQRNKKPRAVLNRGAAFVATRAKNKLPEGIWERITGKRLPIRPLFFFKRGVVIKAAFDFGPTGMAVARRVYEQHFGKRLANAILTAK